MKLSDTRIAKVLSDESGASTIEYGILVLVVIGVATAASTSLKTALADIFTKVTAAITALSV